MIWYDMIWYDMIWYIRFWFIFWVNHTHSPSSPHCGQGTPLWFNRRQRTMVGKAKVTPSHAPSCLESFSQVSGETFAGRKTKLKTANLLLMHAQIYIYIYIYVYVYIYICVCVCMLVDCLNVLTCVVDRIYIYISIYKIQYFGILRISNRIKHIQNRSKQEDTSEVRAPGNSSKSLYQPCTKLSNQCLHLHRKPPSLGQSHDISWPKFKLELHTYKKYKNIQRLHIIYPSEQGPPSKRNPWKMPGANLRQWSGTKASWASSSESQSLGKAMMLIQMGNGENMCII